MIATQPALIGRRPTFVSTNRGRSVPNHGAQFSLTHPPNPITLTLIFTVVSWRSVVPNAARSKEPPAMLPSSLGSPEEHRHDYDWPQCHLPERISGLWPLALNLWWTWHQEAREVFRRLDYPLWRLTSHNPVRMLHVMPNQRLTEAARDPTFLSLYDAAIERLGRALVGKDSWWAQSFPQLPHRPIPYFSAEFALHQSLPIYAGGLGVLAGDHCKEACDLGVPLVGVGFMYPQGYFHQHVSAEGWQEESYERLNWTDAPIEAALTADGRPLLPAVPLGDRSVLVAVWRVCVGRVTLYLLDTDLEENAPWDRELSARLYGGNQETRIQQEIILGIGGVRVLRALGIAPGVFHLNEGHAGFVVLQRIRDLLEQGSTFDT